MDGVLQQPPQKKQGFFFSNIPRQYRRVIPRAVCAYSVRQQESHQRNSWARLRPDRRYSLSVARNDECWSRQRSSRCSRKRTIQGKWGPWVRHRWWLLGWQLKLQGLWGASCIVYRLVPLATASDSLVRDDLVRWTWGWSRSRQYSHITTE